MLNLHWRCETTSVNVFWVCCHVVVSISTVQSNQCWLFGQEKQALMIGCERILHEKAISSKTEQWTYIIIIMSNESRSIIFCAIIFFPLVYSFCFVVRSNFTLSAFCTMLIRLFGFSRIYVFSEIRQEKKM